MRSVVTILLMIAVSACSPKRMGINRMADALTSTASSFARDDDPEFVRHAAPSTLKMLEMLLEEQPRHAGLLLTACSGFTQYAYAFLHAESDMLDGPDEPAARELKARAKRMYDRAGGYCERALTLRHPGVSELRDRPSGVLAAMDARDVPVLYWTAAARGGSIATSDNPLVRIGELATVKQLLTRAIQLDERWSNGALHEAMIVVEGLPRVMGGSADRARSHFARAVELSAGQSAFAYVTLASDVARPGKNREEFERLLRTALAIDVARTPDLRLANLIAQRRARFLLSRVDRLF